MPAPEYNQVGIPSFNTNFSGINWTGIAPAWNEAIKGLQLGIQSNADADLYKALSGASNYDEMVAARRSEEFQNSLKNASPEGRKNAFNFLENMARIDETRALTRGTNLDSDEKERVLQAKQYADAHPDVAMQLRGLVQTAKNRGYYTRKESEIISNLLANYPGGTTTALDYLFPDVNGTFESRAREDNSKAQAQHARAEAGLANAKTRSINNQIAQAKELQANLPKYYGGIQSLLEIRQKDPEHYEKIMQQPFIRQTIAKMRASGFPVDSVLQSTSNNIKADFDLSTLTRTQNLIKEYTNKGILTKDPRAFKYLIDNIPPNKLGKSPAERQATIQALAQYYGVPAEYALTGENQVDIGKLPDPSDFPSSEDSTKASDALNKTVSNNNTEEIEKSWLKQTKNTTVEDTASAIETINKSYGLEKKLNSGLLSKDTRQDLFDTLKKKRYTPKSNNSEDIAEAVERYTKETGESAESLIKEAFKIPSYDQMQLDLGNITPKQKYQRANTPLPFDVSTLHQTPDVPNTPITSHANNVTNALSQVTNPRGEGYFNPNGKFVSTTPSSSIFGNEENPIDAMMRRSAETGQGIKDAVEGTQKQLEETEQQKKDLGYYLEHAADALRDNPNNGTIIAANDVYNAGISGQITATNVQDVLNATDQVIDKMEYNIDEPYLQNGNSLRDMAPYFIGEKKDITRENLVNNLKDLPDNDGKKISVPALNELINQATSDYKVPIGVLKNMMDAAMQDSRFFNWGDRINFCKKTMQKISTLFKNNQAQKDLYRIVSLEKRRKIAKTNLADRVTTPGINASYERNLASRKLNAMDATGRDQELHDSLLSRY